MCIWMFMFVLGCGSGRDSQDGNLEARSIVEAGIKMMTEREHSLVPINYPVFRERISNTDPIHNRSYRYLKERSRVSL